MSSLDDPHQLIAIITMTVIAFIYVMVVNLSLFFVLTFKKLNSFCHTCVNSSVFCIVPTVQRQRMIQRKKIRQMVTEFI